MSKFIGVKMVDAVPMTAEEAIKNHYIVSAFSSEKDGYEVTYNDGYKSWCPKSIFERTYFEIKFDDKLCFSFREGKIVNSCEFICYYPKTYIGVQFAEYNKYQIIDKMKNIKSQVYDSIVSNDKFYLVKKNKKWGVIKYDSVFEQVTNIKYKNAKFINNRIALLSNANFWEYYKIDTKPKLLIRTKILCEPYQCLDDKLIGIFKTEKGKYDLLYYDKSTFEEFEYINKLDTINREKGYNLRRDSTKTGMIPLDETKERYSIAMKLRYSRESERLKQSIRSKHFWENNSEKKEIMKEKVSKAITKYTVKQYDKSANFIKEWTRVKDIIKENPTYKVHNIYAVCSGEKPSIYGYVWTKCKIKI